MAFGSYRDALMIMLNLPLALVGGVAGVFVAGGVLSLASIVGFIALFGIATRNGIMMISDIHHLESQGALDFRESVMQGDSDDRACGQPCVAADCAGDGQARKRDSGSDGHRDFLWLNMVVVPAAYYRFRRRLAA
jgi:hypothetical protein